MKNTFTISLMILISMSFGAIGQNQPESPFEISFSERARVTSFDNAISLNDDQNGWTFARFRTSLGAAYRPLQNLQLNLNIANENWLWLSPENRENRFSEIFIDQFNVHWKISDEFPLEIKAGRQNLLFDEGFICLDAQPLTGSRSIYFDAVKAEYRINSLSALTVFAARAREFDTFLPIINEGKQPKRLVEQGNNGYGVYFKRKAGHADLSFYFFRKETHPTEEWREKWIVNAPGFRVQIPLENFSFTGEATLQFGERGQNAHKAFGGYAYADYSIADNFLIEKLTAGSFYLSGDAESTASNEAWNPMWARWPKWSESYIYTHISEYNGKIAYWSNISSFYLTVKGNSGQNISHVISFYHLMANQNNLRDVAFGDGKTRGELIIYRMNFKLNNKWSGHLLYERFFPGNYYEKGADEYNWARIELLYEI